MSDYGSSELYFCTSGFYLPAFSKRSSSAVSQLLQHTTTQAQSLGKRSVCRNIKSRLWCAQKFVLRVWDNVKATCNSCATFGS
eukprot:4295502-Amphidinium_carterae.1